jgi:hypothetical protein
MNTSPVNRKSSSPLSRSNGLPLGRRDPRRHAAAWLLTLTLGLASTPARAVEATHFTTLGSFTATEFTLTARVAGTTAYLPDWTAGVQILDVSNPAAPVKVGNLDTPGRRSTSCFREIGLTWPTANRA